MEDIEKLFDKAVGEIERMLNTKTVVGEPITVEGNTLIPLIISRFKQNPPLWIAKRRHRKPFAISDHPVKVKMPLVLFDSRYFVDGSSNSLVIFGMRFE